MGYRVPAILVTNSAATPERRAWLEHLPAIVREVETGWSLRLHAPFQDASCAWVAAVMLTDGTSAVLKLGMPHMEAEHEIDGLHFWNGDPTVRLLNSDDNPGRC